MKTRCLLQMVGRSSIMVFPCQRVAAKTQTAVASVWNTNTAHCCSTFLLLSVIQLILRRKTMKFLFNSVGGIQWGNGSGLHAGRLFLFILQWYGLPVAVLHGVEQCCTGVRQGLQRQEKQKRFDLASWSKDSLILRNVTWITCESETTDILWKKKDASLFRAWPIWRSNKNATTHPGEVKYVLVYRLHCLDPLLVGVLVVDAAVVLSVVNYKRARCDIAIWKLSSAVVWPRLQ